MTKRTVPPKQRRRAPARRRIDQREVDRDEPPFDAATELENLRGDVQDIEAVARAAQAALEGLPGGGTLDERRDRARLYALVDMTAKVAIAALDHADEAQARLDAHMARLRDG